MPTLARMAARSVAFAVVVMTSLLPLPTTREAAPTLERTSAPVSVWLTADKPLPTRPKPLEMSAPSSAARAALPTAPASGIDGIAIAAAASTAPDSKRYAFVFGSRKVDANPRPRVKASPLIVPRYLRTRSD